MPPHLHHYARSMNKGTTRGSAAGFDLDALRSLMTIKRQSRSGDPGVVTLMHYLANLLGSRGVSGKALRCQLSRVADAASLDLLELEREVQRLETDAEAIRAEVVIAAREGGEGGRETVVSPPDPPPLEGDGFDMKAVEAFAAARFHLALGDSVDSCVACVQELRARLERGRQELRLVASSFGGGRSGEGSEEQGQARLAAVVDFMASLEKAERDNGREARLDSTLRKLQHVRGQTVPLAATPPLVAKRTHSAPLPPPPPLPHPRLHTGHAAVPAAPNSVHTFTIDGASQTLRCAGAAAHAPRERDACGCVGSAEGPPRFRRSLSQPTDEIGGPQLASTSGAGIHEGSQGESSISHFRRAACGGGTPTSVPLEAAYSEPGDYF